MPSNRQMFNEDIHILGDMLTVVARQFSSKLNDTLCSLLPRIVRSKLATGFVGSICSREFTVFEYGDDHTVVDCKSAFHFTPADRLAY